MKRFMIGRKEPQRFVLFIGMNGYKERKNTKDSILSRGGIARKERKRTQKRRGEKIDARIGSAYRLIVWPRKVMKRHLLNQFSVLLLILTVCTTNMWGGSGAPLHGRQFAIIDIAESAGGNFGWASAVNNAGQVIGVANTGGESPYSAFIYDQARGLRFLPVPAGGVFTSPVAINEEGAVVGHTFINNGARTVLWTGDGQLVDLQPGSVWATALALSINDRGQVVGGLPGGGFVYDPAIGFVINHNVGFFTDLNNHGELVGGSSVLIYKGGAFFEGPLLPFSARELRAISDAGVVVGTMNGSQGWPRAFSWNSRRRHGPTELGTLPTGLQSHAHDVNRHGQIVGWSSSNGFDIGKAVLWERERIYDLNNYLPANSGWTSLRGARGINDNGHIVGIGYNARGQAPFLLVPLPRK
jgi:probable HAF family extracellular repeat protein